MNLFYNPKLLNYSQFLEGVTSNLLTYTITGTVISTMLITSLTINTPIFEIKKRSAIFHALVIVGYVTAFPLIVIIDSIMMIVSFCRGQTRYLENRAKIRRISLQIVGGILLTETALILGNYLHNQSKI